MRGGWKLVPSVTEHADAKFLFCVFAGARFLTTPELWLAVGVRIRSVSEMPVYGFCGRKATLNQLKLIQFELVECCFTSTETVGVIRDGSPGRPPRLSHISWALGISLLDKTLKFRFLLLFISPFVVVVVVVVALLLLLLLLQQQELQGSRRDQEEGGGAGPSVSPEEIMSREVELGCESWTSFASSCSSTAVQRTLSLWLCPARQLKQQ